MKPLDVEETEQFLPDEEQESTPCSVPNTTYWNLIGHHANFRGFILSYIITHMGEWLTYLASLSMLDSGADFNRISIAILVVCRMLPTTLFSPVGGILADSYDRRRIMIVLDFIGAAVAFLFLLAYQMDNMVLLYVATIAQEAVAGVYEPCRSAIVPQLVPLEYVPKATTMSGWVWSVLAALASSMGGILVALVGIPLCFLLDSATYVLSAILLWTQVNGNYDVTVEAKAAGKNTESSSMIRETWMFLASSGPWFLLKGCGATMFGASDVLAVGFAQVDEGLSSERLGAVFACVGIGCFLGPGLIQHFFPEELRVWKWSCVLSFLALATGFLGLSRHGYFWEKLVWTILRAGGVAVLWINSSLILQTATPNHLLGRVMAVDLALATVGEAVGAMLAGWLQDYCDFDAEKVAFWLSIESFAWGILWLGYLVCCPRQADGSRTPDT